MAFSREDLTVYEAKPQIEVDSKTFDPFNPTEPQVKVEVAPESSSEVITEPPVEGIDGSTTEPEAEPVAAELDNPEVDKDPNPEVPEDGRPRSRAQERITELVDERNAVKEYNKYLQSKLDELLRNVQATKSVPESSPVKAPQANPEDVAPTLESVGFDPVELNKKQNEWIQKQVDRRVESAVKQIEIRQSEVAIRQAFETRAVEFSKTTPDFNLVLSNPALPKLAPDAAVVVIKSENGPAIAYHLGKNPDVATRIAKMDPPSQAAAIGRLEEQIIRATADAKNTQEPSKTVIKAPAKVTKAPPPPKPVSGGTAPVTKDMAQMTMEEWVAAERGRKIADRVAKQKMRQSLR